MPAPHQYRNLSKHTDTRQAFQQCCTRPMLQALWLSSWRPFTPAAAYARRQRTCKPSHCLPSVLSQQSTMAYFSPFEPVAAALLVLVSFPCGTDLTTLPRSSWLIWVETPSHSLSFQLTYGPPDATSLSHPQGHDGQSLWQQG